MADADDMGAVHVQVWNETYRGIMPDRVLDAMSGVERSEAWRTRIAERDQNGLFGILVAVQDERIVGFSACGPQRDEAMNALGFAAEFLVLNLVRTAQGHGLGRRMMATMARLMLEKGYSAASLWVVRNNPSACGFYEHLGGRLAGEKTETRLGLDLPEVAYAWRDFSPIGIEPRSP